jgi:hypothetical protein
MVVIAALAFRAAIVRGDGLTPQPAAPTNTIAGPETATTSPPPTDTPEPDTSATPVPRGSPEPTECPVGDPAARQRHPSDGRVHGGGLSFPKTADFAPTTRQLYFSWAYDVAGQDRAVDERWYSTYVVGALPTFDGFETPKQSAEMVLDCTVSSPLYRGFTGRTEVSSRPTAIDKRKGWELRSQVRVDSPDIGVSGDTVVVVVIDTGSPESLAMFWACVPTGDATALRQLEAVVGRLQVE